jgi:hypothetical protein
LIVPVSGGPLRKIDLGAETSGDPLRISDGRQITLAAGKSNGEVWAENLPAQSASKQTANR